MKSRQATSLLIIFPLLAAGLFACLPSNQPAPAPEIDPPTLAPSATATQPPTQTPTPTPLACLTRPGELQSGKIDATNPAQEFMIYLPPCYAEMTDKRYPVLYLLHGQTYMDDQWPRLGVDEQADQLIHSGEAPPFIIVFPDDRYWNAPAGPGFGIRFIEFVVPYIDKNYRTLPERKYRALGGLSRGGGWTIRLGFEHWDMFGTLGLHSPAVFVDDGEFLSRWIAAIPKESFPRLWIDIGDQDSELMFTRNLENILTAQGLPHEFHFYNGAHTEEYWRAHAAEYLRFYAESWQDLPKQ